MKRRLVLGCLVLSLSCADSNPGGIVDPDTTPRGPAPAVEASVQFGGAPVEGAVYLVPGEATAGWAYAIDLDEDGEVDQEGILEAEWVGFDYRFEAPGTHAVRVDLSGPDGVETVSVPVVVDRPTAVRVVAENRVELDLEGGASFEGMVATQDGSTLYVGDFSAGWIVALDGATLEPTTRVRLWHGVEGLSISPSGEYLFAAFKDWGAARLELPDLVPDVTREEYRWDGFYAAALDDRMVLTGGGVDGLTIHDVVAGEVVRRTEEIEGHFDLDRDGDRAVAADPGAGSSGLTFVRLPELAVTRSLQLPAGMRPTRVVFGPGDERIFLITLGGRDPVPVGWSLVVLDAASGEIERIVSLDDGGCFALCVASPVARSRDGRYVAFETDPGVLIVDTGTGLPLARGPWGSVAASPVEAATFWVLAQNGVVRKIVVDPEE